MSTRSPRRCRGATVHYPVARRHDCDFLQTSANNCEQPGEKVFVAVSMRRMLAGVSWREQAVGHELRLVANTVDLAFAQKLQIFSAVQCELDTR